MVDRIKCCERLIKTAPGRYVYMTALYPDIVLFIDTFIDGNIEVGATYKHMLVEKEPVQKYFLETNDLDDVMMKLDHGFMDPMDIEHNDIEPAFRDLKWNSERKIVIYTWGTRKRKHAPEESEHNFNSTIIEERRSMISFRQDTGRNPETQRILKRAMKYVHFMRSMIQKIESADLHCISINSTMGLHRSVGCAEILKQDFYPNAIIHHM